MDSYPDDSHQTFMFPVHLHIYSLIITKATPPEGSVRPVIGRGDFAFQPSLGMSPLLVGAKHSPPFGEDSRLVSLRLPAHTRDRFLVLFCQSWKIQKKQMPI